MWGKDAKRTVEDAGPYNSALRAEDGKNGGGWTVEDAGPYILPSL